MPEIMSEKIRLAEIAVVTISILFVAGFITAKHVNAETDSVMTVYKSPTCGCCNKWISHMQENGFKIEAIDVQNIDLVKQHYGISKRIASCHTAIVDGYVIEGHVPANDVKKMLSEKKDILGLSVPGMPIGSPGMEMGNRLDRYAVISFDENGNLEIFHQY